MFVRGFAVKLISKEVAGKASVNATDYPSSNIEKPMNIISVNVCKEKGGANENNISYAANLVLRYLNGSE